MAFVMLFFSNDIGRYQDRNVMHILRQIYCTCMTPSNIFYLRSIITLYPEYNVYNFFQHFLLLNQLTEYLDRFVLSKWWGQEKEIALSRQIFYIK